MSRTQTPSRPYFESMPAIGSVLSDNDITRTLENVDSVREQERIIAKEVERVENAGIPAKKIHDFSLHQFPTVNLLQELEENTGIEVLILAAQIEFIPTEIAPGLSPAMSKAVP